MGILNKYLLVILESVFLVGAHFRQPMKKMLTGRVAYFLLVERTCDLSLVAALDKLFLGKANGLTG